MSLKSLQLMQQFKYDPRYDMSNVKVFFVDRGSPDDVSSVEGTNISMSDNHFFFNINNGIDVKSVPYHRIYRIEYGGKCMFERSLISASDLNAVLGVDYMTERKLKNGVDKNESQ
jgi:uncharacterized protein (UPF0248 family)